MQCTIAKQILKFLPQYTEELRNKHIIVDQEYIEVLLESFKEVTMEDELRGHCYGFSLLWLYSSYKSIFPLKNNANIDNRAKFNSIIKMIKDWNGEIGSLKPEQKEDFRIFIETLSFFQESRKYLTGVSEFDFKTIIQDFNTPPNLKPINPELEFSVVLPVSRTDLYKYINKRHLFLLKNITLGKKSIIFVANNHATAAFNVSNEIYRYFDANIEGEQYLTFEELLQEVVKSGHVFKNTDNDFSLSIKVFSMQKYDNSCVKPNDCILQNVKNNELSEDFKEKLFFNAFSFDCPESLEYYLNILKTTKEGQIEYLKKTNKYEHDFFLKAITHNRIKILKDFFLKEQQYGFFINNKYGFSKVRAIFNNKSSYEVINALIEKTPNLIIGGNSSGLQVLKSIIDVNNNIDIFKLVLSKLEAEPETKINNYSELLVYAAYNKRFDVVKYLLIDEKIEISENAICKLFCLACKHGCEYIVRYLITEKNLTFSNEYGDDGRYRSFFANMIVLEEGEQEGKKYCENNKVADKNYSAIIIAAYYQHLELVKYLYGEYLSKKINLSYRELYLLLAISCMNNWFEFSKKLVEEKNIDIEESKYFKNTTIFTLVARFSDCYEEIKYFSKKKLMSYNLKESYNFLQTACINMWPVAKDLIEEYMQDDRIDIIGEVFDKSKFNKARDCIIEIIKDKEINHPKFLKNEISDYYVVHLCFRGRKDIVDYLVYKMKKLDFNREYFFDDTFEKKCSLLIIAAEFNQRELVEYILSKEGEIVINSKILYFLLCFACTNKWNDIYDDIISFLAKDKGVGRENNAVDNVIINGNCHMIAISNEDKKDISKRFIASLIKMGCSDFIADSIKKLKISIDKKIVESFLVRKELSIKHVFLEIFKEICDRSVNGCKFICTAQGQEQLKLIFEIAFGYVTKDNDICNKMIEIIFEAFKHIDFKNPKERIRKNSIIYSLAQALKEQKNSEQVINMILKFPNPYDNNKIVNAKSYIIREAYRVLAREDDKIIDSDNIYKAAEGLIGFLQKRPQQQDVTENNSDNFKKIKETIEHTSPCRFLL